MPRIQGLEDHILSILSEAVVPSIEQMRVCVGRLLKDKKVGHIVRYFMVARHETTNVYKVPDGDVPALFETCVEIMKFDDEEEMREFLREHMESDASGEIVKAFMLSYFEATDVSQLSGAPLLQVFSEMIRLCGALEPAKANDS